MLLVIIINFKYQIKVVSNSYLFISICNSVSTSFCIIIRIYSLYSDLSIKYIRILSKYTIQYLFNLLNRV